MARTSPGTLGGLCWSITISITSFDCSRQVGDAGRSLLEQKESGEVCILSAAKGHILGICESGLV